MSTTRSKPDELLRRVRLIIFDADDTLRRTTVAGQPCPHADGEWELLPGVRERLTAIDWRGRGLAIGVASNQDHVGYGLVDATTAEQLLRAMVDAATGGLVPDPEIRFCSHRLDVACDCRKPAPGMLIDIMRARRIAPHETLFVGNAPTDAEAARRAGVAFVHAEEFFACSAASGRSSRHFGICRSVRLHRAADDTDRT